MQEGEKMTFERFWNHDLNPDLAMQPFTWQHGILILLGILSVILTLKFAAKIKNLTFEKRVKRGFAIWLLFLELIYHLHYWSYGMFSVPLHICSFGVMFSITILFTDSKKAFEFLFFIGIFGGLLAMTFAGVPSEAFITGIQMDFEPYHIFYSYIKTILFALILATVPSYHGYYMRGGALEVGKASTKSFVWTSIIIIVVNFIITQLLLS